LLTTGPNVSDAPQDLVTAAILVVDDHPPNLLALEAVLAPLGHRIVRAGSGEDALTRLRQEEFAVVLLDVMMPGMDGFRTADRVRAREHTEPVPIIFMTAGDTPSLQGYAHGAVDYVYKPFDPAVIRAKVAVFVELFRAREQVRQQAARLAAQRQEVEARNTALLNASLDAIIGMDHRGRITEFNTSAEEIFGRRRSDVLGHSMAELLIPAHQRERHVRGLARYLATGERHVLDTRIEINALHASGTEFPIELAIRRVASDGPPTFMGYARDLRQRNRADRARAFLSDASEAFASSLDYEATLRTIGSMTVPAMADWCVVDLLVSAGAPQRLVVAHVDPAKVELAEQLRWRYPVDPNAATGVARVLRDGEPELYEEVSDALVERSARDPEHLRILRELGLCSAMIVPLVARGRTLGAITFVAADSGRRYTRFDLETAEELARRAAIGVENARLYREAQEVNRLKDEFLATVSHELRTPLAAILSWAHLLRTGRPELVARAIETIERNAHAQARIVEDVLDVSRIITGKLRLRPERVRLADIVQLAVDTVRPAAEAKGVDLGTTLDATSAEIIGDPARLQQVAWNLLSNAIKFTPEGGRVEVSVEQGESNLRLRVHDTGQGIRADFLPHVFERFRQADSASTREHAGLGLGLAIVRHLVELHGGRVTAHSAGEGSGATFIVTLPIRASLP
jgi:PAS domain S-box-containing protein